MAKRLEKLHVDSIDLVDKGAGVGTRIMIAKRDPAVTFAKDGHRWKLAADGDLTDKLIQAAPALGLAVDVAKRTWDLRDPRGKLISSHHSRKDAKRAMRRHRAAARGESADSDTWRADDSLAKAKAEIKANKRFLKENPVMDTQIDIAKAEAITKRFADRVDEIARANFISHQSATMRLASTSALISKSDAELWASYRAASQLIADNRPAPVVAAPVPQVSAAYGELQKRAAELRKNDRKLSEASAFAAVYQDPANRDLVAADRQFHFNKSARLPDPDEVLTQAIMDSMNCDRAHARGVMLEIRSKKPPASTLYGSRNAA